MSFDAISFRKQFLTNDIANIINIETMNVHNRILK